MIYLARLQLNPRSRRAQSEVQNPYELHRTLSRAFGGSPAVWKEARCLFRLEQTRDGDIWVLVQSRTQPDWNYLESAPGFLLSVPQVKALALKLPAGLRLAFRLRANPTQCQNGKRTPLLSETDQRHWLERKGELHGFELGSVRISSPEIVCLRTAQGHSVTLQAIVYDGVLTITDADRFVEALERGIGPAKGLGFGLLSVAKLPVSE